MRRKVSTIVDDSLLRSVKLEAVRRGKQFSQVVAEALEVYMGREGRSPGLGVVGETWAALPLDAGALRRLLAEEDGLLNA